MQRRGRVIHRHVDHPVAAPGLPMNLANRLAGEKLGHREPTESNDHLRSNRRDLPLEEMIARGHFVRLRIAIVGRPAFHDIGNEHARTVQADRREQLLKELARGANEWSSLAIFVVPWSLPDEHDLRRRRSFTGNGLVSGSREHARGAYRDLTRDLLELRGNLHSSLDCRPPSWIEL